MVNRIINSAVRKDYGRWVLMMGFIWVLGACAVIDTPTDPGTDPPDDTADLDPGSGLMDLKSIDLIGPDGNIVPVSLLGSEMLVQADGTVTLEVALRNDGYMDLSPPLLLWLSEFDPPAVMLTNADTMFNEADTTLSPKYGFDYSGTLGIDALLAPDQISGTRTWIFYDPDLLPFSFTGWAEGGFGPPPAFLGGEVFDDLNYDGVRDAAEPPLGNVPLRVRFPDGFEMFTLSGPNGGFDVMTDQVGLYEVSIDFPPFMPPGAPRVTTPTPLFVTLVPGPDGQPLNYDGLLFGVADFHDIPPILDPLIFTPLLPADLQVGPWSLVMGEILDDFIFHAFVEYSGCQPGHAFSLYASGEIQVGLPPRVVITLVDEMAEDCGAVFEQELIFDLWPLKETFAAGFDSPELALDLVGFDGTVLATFMMNMHGPLP